MKEYQNLSWLLDKFVSPNYPGHDLTGFNYWSNHERSKRIFRPKASSRRLGGNGDGAAIVFGVKAL